MKRLSKKTVPVEIQGKRCYVGVDVHKASYYVSVLAEDGARREFAAKADPDALIDSLLGTMEVEIIALAHESGPTGYALAWACQDAGVPVLVAASSRIPRPITSASKTDRLDCMKLADYLAKGMLQSIAIPDRDDFAFRELNRRKIRLTRSRSKLKQEIKSFLLKNAMAEPQELKHWSNEGIRILREMSLSKALRATLDLLLDELETLSLHIAKARKLLKGIALEHEKHQIITNLQTIPGIGEVISYTFATEIFQPQRFETKGQVSSYVGLAPQIKQSGESKARARLRSVGQKHLRCSLTEGAWIWIKHEPEAKALYDRVRAKTNLPQKAIVAVARKLLIVLWRIAVENRPYKLSTAA